MLVALEAILRIDPALERRERRRRRIHAPELRRRQKFVLGEIDPAASLDDQVEQLGERRAERRAVAWFAQAHRYAQAVTREPQQEIIGDMALHGHENWPYPLRL